MKLIIRASVIACLIAFFLKLSLDISFIQDDAFTSFRYVDNFLNGKGLVFNEGEFVEGYTNFLWVMILSLLGFLKLDYVSFSTQLSLLFGACSVVAVYFLTLRINKSFYENNFSSEIMNFIPAALFSLTGGFHYWSVSGMETSLFVFLILSAVYIYFGLNSLRKGIILQAVLLLSALTRPEGMFFWIIIFSHRLFISRKRIKETIDKNFIFEQLIFMVPILIYLGFRLTYYGHFLPNTFFAKTGFGFFYIYRGFDYLGESFSTYFIYGLLLILPILLFRYKEFFREISFYILTLSAYFTAVVLIGGDVLPFHRFLLPVIPLVYVYSVSAIIMLIRSNDKLNSLKDLSACIISAFFIFYFITIYHRELPVINSTRGFEIGLVKKMRIYADYVGRISAVKNIQPRVSLSTIGAFSYYSDAEVIDLIGLTDKYIAHNPKETEGIDDSIPLAWRERRYNIDYVLNEKPHFIIFPAGAKPSAFPEAALFGSELFHKQYFPQLFYSRELNQYLPVFTRRDLFEGSPPAEIEFSQQCDISFVANYIRANNYFLRMTETGDSSLLSLIFKECDEIIARCPSRTSQAAAVIGYSYFHRENLLQAENYLKKSLEIDEMNCISRLYLMKTYIKKNDMPNFWDCYHELKKFSPLLFDETFAIN